MVHNLKVLMVKNVDVTILTVAPSIASTRLGLFKCLSAAFFVGSMKRWLISSTEQMDPEQCWFSTHFIREHPEQDV